MPEPDPLADLRSAIHTFATVLAGVAPEQQTLATPCSDWSVSDLIDHVIDGNAYFADVVAGRTARDEPPGPGQGERFDWSAHALLDALSTNAASTGTYRGVWPRFG